jgi:Heterokaryon incompatibility protein (HET)
MDRSGKFRLPAHCLSSSLTELQECIQQDNEFEKAIAIQAMDLVYVNAHVTIGLFSTMLEQQHLENLLFFEEQVLASLNILPRGSTHTTTRRRQTVRVQALTEAFQRIVSDPWNTRAWVLQEAFASAGNLLILFPAAKHVSTKHLQLVCHERSFSEICIDFQVLFTSLKTAKELIGRSSRGVVIESTTEKLQWLHPETPKRGLFEMSIAHTQLRSTCNAAVALSFLRQRENSVVADRLAIIANLCGYELRLDTSSLEKSESSLGVCVLALAIMNGDFSLLIPEIYDAPSLQRNADICAYSTM